MNKNNESDTGQKKTSYEQTREVGRSQSGLRAYNERQILSLIRRQTAVSKTEIASETGLSAQAATVIIKKLEAEHLVVKKTPQRGRVGQPSVPFALNPDGAFGIGLKVGRRSFDLTLIDFIGEVRGTLHETFPYPTVEHLAQFLHKGIDVLTMSLSPELSARITGIGVATPFELWSWAEEVGAPVEVLNQWREFDFKGCIGEFSELEVYICNDDTAACAAELSFGNPSRYTDYLYMFIGSFIGGGVVINNSLVSGHRGNAGAIGSLPVPVLHPDGGVGSQQLIMQASINVLDKLLIAEGKSSETIWNSFEYWGDLGSTLDEWIESVAESLAYATVCGISIFDFEAIIIDGALPISVRESIVKHTKGKIRNADLRGLSSVEVVAGTIGGRAQSIGSASLPIVANFGQSNKNIFRNKL